MITELQIFRLLQVEGWADIHFRAESASCIVGLGFDGKIVPLNVSCRLIGLSLLSGQQ